MGAPRPARNGLPRSTQPSKLPQRPCSSELEPPEPSLPNPNNKLKTPTLLDPNISNPRLLVNRACIYERRLPGDAFITAHVARLQHGFYASQAVSDKDAEHVDFLAIGFVFHAPHTLEHRFKSATIKVAICGSHEISKSPQYPHGFPPGNPRFLMHAPHLIYGHISPETMEWTFSVAGSLGVSETPVSASLIPSGSSSARYRRYEMMRIQGSARTLKSPRGPQYDVQAGEIFWSLEENNLQRSGLPREFTFVMLVQKPTADSQLTLTLEVEPVIQALVGSYPSWLLSFSQYQPLPRRGVNFNSEVGQRFEPTDEARGFNFAALESSFDEYIAMPGRKFSRQIDYPVETPLPSNDNPNQGGYPQFGNYNPNYPLYSSLNPLQQLHFNGMVLQNTMLQAQLNQLSTTQTSAQRAVQASNINTLDVYHNLDDTTISLPAGLRVFSPPAMSGVAIEGSDTEACTSDVTAIGLGEDARFQSYENVRASMLRTVHPELRSERFKASLHAGRTQRKRRVERTSSRQQVMRLENQPLSSALISRLSELRSFEEEGDEDVDAEEWLI
ncbi:hypothetical protein PMG11_08100 [Penicillium brasilianum]|uniref:Uncharacterized protein n=1 Tax=Penicillium brasilianum TaxID=104259 RepID=A0A0F7TVR7_PENBI|nr:hypothetical protein PMG11_08100 [Penicillium brasilianum]